MVRAVIIILSSALLFSCVQTDSDEAEIEVVHNNVVIITDHTNRLDRPKLLHDTTVIKKITSTYWDTTLLYATKKLGHRDRFIYRRMSEQNWISSNDELDRIDLSSFKDNYSRNRYIKCKSDVCINNDLNRFKKTIAIQYRRGGMASGSLFQVLKNLDDRFLKEPGVFYRDETAKISQINRNVILIFSDGYIEYGNYNSDMIDGMYLSRGQVSDIITQKNRNNTSILEAANSLGNVMKALDNDYLKGAEIYLLESDDLSLTKNGNPTTIPTHREVYSEVWRDWLLRSGVKSFEVLEPFKNEQDIQDFVKKTFYSTDK